MSGCLTKRCVNPLCIPSKTCLKEFKNNLSLHIKQRSDQGSSLCIATEAGRKYRQTRLSKGAQQFYRLSSNASSLLSPFSEEAFLLLLAHGGRNPDCFISNLNTTQRFDLADGLGCLFSHFKGF